MERVFWQIGRRATPRGLSLLAQYSEVVCKCFFQKLFTFFSGPFSLFIAIICKYLRVVLLFAASSLGRAVLRLLAELLAHVFLWAFFLPLGRAIKSRPFPSREMSFSQTFAFFRFVAPFSSFKCLPFGLFLSAFSGFRSCGWRP